MLTVDLQQTIFRHNASHGHDSSVNVLDSGLETPQEQDRFWMTSIINKISLSYRCGAR